MAIICQGPIENIEELHGKYGHTVLYAIGEYDSYQVLYIAFENESEAEQWLSDPSNSYIVPIGYLGSITTKPIRVAERVKCFKIDS